MKYWIQKILVLLICILLGASVSTFAEESAPTYEKVVRTPRAHHKKKNKEKVTIMIYMNGSDLESENGEATTDLTEMIKAGSSDQVNVVVQTMGTKKWSKKLGIASNRSQIYEVNGDGLKLVKDDLGQLNCTTEKTFGNFVKWTADNYPANRYILLFWNHGGGPVYGFGYDEYQDWNESLTIDEIQGGLRNAGVFFDFIGMDCCIMSNLEVCCALYDFCDYVILSEDFESGLGWYYTNWLKALYKNPAIDTASLAKIIIDDMVAKNESNDLNGDEAILSFIDEGQMKLLMSAWVNFAYANERELTGNNYSQKRSRRGPVRVHPKFSASNFFSWWFDDEDIQMSDYYVTDIMAVAENVNSDESDALASAISKAILYSNCTSGNEGLTGLAVSLPYGDSEFYSEMKRVFTNCGFDDGYVAWLRKFVNASGKTDYYDYDDWEEEWNGWDDYEDDYDWSLWDLFDDDEFWEDEDTWGWTEEDSYSEGDGLLGFLDWLLSDDEDMYSSDDEEEGDFFDWLFEDDAEDDYEDDYYSYDSYDYEGDYDDEYDDFDGDGLIDFIEWLFE